MDDRHIGSNSQHRPPDQILANTDHRDVNRVDLLLEGDANCAPNRYRKLALAAASATNCHAPTQSVIRKNAPVFLMTMKARTSLRNQITRLTERAKFGQEPPRRAVLARRFRPAEGAIWSTSGRRP
jgi:hypothetical protein